MNPPLLEVILQLNYELVNFASDRLQYFYRMNSDLLAETEEVQKPGIILFRSIDRNESFLISNDQAQLRSKRGVSFPRLRPQWARILDSFLDIFGISMVHGVSLSYLNEIPLQDLRNFRNYLNIRFEMPAPLNERFEFFRSEFTYKYDFGEIRVWLQPDWDEQMENYCIQLNLQSMQIGKLPARDLFLKTQQLHEGIKDVFGQILSQSYIRQLPQ